MSLSVIEGGWWDEAFAPLVQESRALPGVTGSRARRLREWVDWMADRMRHRELFTLAAVEGGRPIGLIGYHRTSETVRISYLFLRRTHRADLPAFLREAETLWQPVRRIVVEGGPQTCLDEAIGQKGFTQAGYRRFERVRYERRLDVPLPLGPLPAGSQEGVTALPLGNIPALVSLQSVGYIGSPDYLLIDDFGAMVYELLEDPWFAPDLSYAIIDEEGLRAALYTFRKGQTAWIASLCVHPATRGRGYARRLLTHALACYQAAGFRRAGLHATVGNAPATRLYERMGFHIAAHTALLYAREFGEPFSP